MANQPTLGFLLHDVARLLRKRFEQRAKGLGLTRSQWQTLAYLANNEGIHQGGLADILEIEPITLVRILDKLAERGLIERRQHPTDRRIWLLYMRDAARPLLADMRVLGEETRGEALQSISPEQREQLFNILSVMKTNLLQACRAPVAETRSSMAEQPSLRVVSETDAKNPSEDKQNTIVADNKETVAEAPASKPAPASVVAPSPPAPAPAKAKRKRGLTRPILFLLLPVALLVGGYYYVNGGQIMSTDNAYVQADMVGLTTDVSGIVEKIDVHENETVKAGQVLFSLRSDAFKIALAGAQAQLGIQRNQILNLKASYQQTLAEITQAEADLPYYQTQFDRQETLVKSAAATRSDYDEAKHNLDAAKQKVSVAKAQAATTLAQLGGNADQPVEDNPLYLQAQSAVENAKRELDHSVVKAPFDGIVTNVSALQVGSYLESPAQAFSLVSTNHLWIAASPKETELTYVKPGQSVTISVDSYPGVEWKGKVESISPASGSSFALLPAQNTTGNWVKVVQRIPMRVSIDDTAGKPPLRVGMSTIVDVNTGHTRGLPDFVTSLLAGIGHKDWEQYIVTSHE